MGSRRSQRGQALALLVVMLGTLTAGFVMLLQIGQLAVERLRVTNAADAAVLSAATWQARALNLTATLNRAAVANEAAIAQSVSLRSWSGYIDRLLPNMNQVLRYVPYLGAATTGLQRVWHGIDTFAQPALRTAEGAASLADHDFALSSELLVRSAASTSQTVAEAAILAADIPVRWSPAGRQAWQQSQLDWDLFTLPRAGGSRGRQADLVLRSTDRFTRQRNHRLAIEPASRLVRIEKRGGTELFNYRSWQGLDTQSLHGRRFGFFGAMRERLPLGWGGANAGQAVLQPGRYGESAAVNPAATRRALAALTRNAAYLGIPALRDVSGIAPGSNPQHRLQLQLVASGFNGVPLVADAAAVVRYQRPQPRRDAAEELANLYEPYWHARLAPLPGRRP